MRCRRALTVLLLLAAALPAVALSIDELDATTSVLWIGTVPPATYFVPNPSTTYLVGVTLPLRIVGAFFVEPGLELFGDYYEWTEAYGTAIPTVYESDAGFYTLGILLSAQAGLSFDVSKALALGGAIGLDFLLRFPVEFSNQSPDSVDGRAPAMAYFYGKGRFFYPETRFFLRWHVIDRVDLVLNVRGFYPIFHLWDGLSQSFFDQFMLSAGFGFAVRLAPATSPSAPNAR
jgi:hypothetical protein